ncbi:MAG: TAXI family TRAP transporter solute-binding subunit [Thermodesulfobacteriota bacterium]|nr:TAXI family TRAP transporter solute-binding subunit [Thermodesulfobacteriota bacterium]
MQKVMNHKKKLWLVFFLLFFTGFFWVNPEGSVAQEKKTLLRLGAVPSGSGWYFWLSQTATVINRNLPTVEISVRETGGTRENTIRMSKDELEMGLTEALVAYEAYRGIGRFEGKATPNLRLLWTGATGFMHWAVARDGGIKTFEELEGKLFNPSTVGGGGEYITEKVFEVLGFKTKFYRAKLADAAEAFKDGRIAGFSYNGTLPTPIFVEAHAFRPIRLLSLREDQVKKVSEAYPFLVRTVIPANTYKDVPEAVTMGLFNYVGANKGLPDGVVYDMVRTYWNNLPEIAKAFPLVAKSKPEDMPLSATAPLHRGALKYYREIGLKIPKEAIPPEAQ